MCSMHSQGVILHHHLQVDVRIQCIRHGTFPEVTAAFKDLLNMQENIKTSTLSTLQLFIGLLHGHTSDIEEVNEDRKHLFAQHHKA